MPLRPPKFDLNRTGATGAELTFLDREGKPVHIYRAPDRAVGFGPELTEVDADSYTDTVGAAENNKYRIRYGEIDASVSIDEDHSDEDPPYYVATAKTGVTITASTEAFSFPWGNVTVDTLLVDPLLQGPASPSKFTKAP